jgi:hypothetical protein
MLRTVAASVMAFTVVVAAGASAHAKHFNAPSGVSGRTTPSSGVIMISSDRPQGLACTSAYSLPTIEYAYGGEKAGTVSGLIDGYIRFYNRIGGTEAYEWRQLIPVTLRPLLQNVNFNLPTPRDIASFSYDLETAYNQGLGSAGCEAQDIQMAPLLRARSAAPEPTTWAMLILGVAMVGIAARRRLTRQAPIS